MHSSGNHVVTGVVLLITRACCAESICRSLVDWVGQEGVELFFLDQGVLLAEDDRFDRHFRVRRRMECVYSRKRLRLPALPADTEVFGGGLINLGEMIRHRRALISLPHVYLPVLSLPQAGQVIGTRRIGVLLPAGGDPDHLTESLRLSVALAGCGHSVTVRHTTPQIPAFPAEAEPFLAVMEALQVLFRPLPVPDGEMALEL